MSSLNNFVIAFGWAVLVLGAVIVLSIMATGAASAVHRAAKAYLQAADLFDAVRQWIANNPEKAKRYIGGGRRFGGFRIGPGAGAQKQDGRL